MKVVRTHERSIKRNSTYHVSGNKGPMVLKAEVKQKPKSTRPHFGTRKLTAHSNVMYNNG